MLSVKETSGTRQFRAVSGNIQTLGESPRAALDALLARHPEDFATPIVISTFNQGDAFFSDEQQARMQTLKARRETLSATEEAELERLVAEAFDATAARAQALLET